MRNGKQYTKTNNDFKKKVLQEYANSDIKIKDLCKKYNISISTLYLWIDKAKRGELFQNDSDKVNYALQEEEIKNNKYDINNDLKDIKYILQEIVTKMDNMEEKILNKLDNKE